MSKLELVKRETLGHGALRGALALGILAVSSVSRAEPGVHPPLVSTSDTRASSVVLAYRQALGPLTARMISYNANFSSTGGILSAQFGAHVLQLQEEKGGNTLYGAGATGTAVWNVPLMSRFDNGVANVALMMYAGGAPVAAVSGERNFLNVPIGVGLGVPLSPKPWVTFTPWFEAAPGLDLDTTINSPDLSRFEPDESDLAEVIQGRDAVIVSEDDVRQAISDSIVVDVAFEAAMRAGLDITLRASDSWSFNVNSYFTTLGSAFSGQSYFYLGAGVLFHWDDTVPAVLPAAVRLQDESCDDIEARFRMCPPKQVQSVCEVPKAASPVVNPVPQSTPIAPEPATPTPQPEPVAPSDSPATDVPASDAGSVSPDGALPTNPAAASFPPVNEPAVNQAPSSNGAPAVSPQAPAQPTLPGAATPAPVAPVAPASPTTAPAPAPAAPKAQLPSSSSPY